MTTAESPPFSGSSTSVTLILFHGGHDMIKTPLHFGLFFQVTFKSASMVNNEKETVLKPMK